MKIAIQNVPGSFSDGWIRYCNDNNINYIVVDVYKSNIVDQIRGCDAFMWHFSNSDYRDNLFAKQLIFSLLQAGLKVFPDFNTSWYYDDKIGEKYLLEIFQAPIVPTYVFYQKEDALKWIDSTSFPKVFKLRCGAGSSNVMLVNSKSQAVQIINKSFGSGWPKISHSYIIRERIRKFHERKANFNYVIKGFIRSFVIPPIIVTMSTREKGYVLFQDFIPDQQYDIRVCVIGDKAFAIKRLVRKNDFRASGSGNVVFDMQQINIDCIKSAFEVNAKIKAESITFDFVNDNGVPKIVEIGFDFSPAPYLNCPGYWDSNLIWHNGHFDFYGWMIDSINN